MQGYLSRIAKIDRKSIVCPETLLKIPPLPIWRRSGGYRATCATFVDSWSKSAGTRAVPTTTGWLIPETLSVNPAVLDTDWAASRREALKSSNRILDLSRTLSADQIKAMSSARDGLIPVSALTPGQKKLLWRITSGGAFGRETAEKNQGELKIGFLVSASVLQRMGQGKGGLDEYLPVFNYLTGQNIEGRIKETEPPKRQAVYAPISPESRIVPSGKVISVQEICRRVSTPALTLVPDARIKDQRLFCAGIDTLSLPFAAELISQVYRTTIAQTGSSTISLARRTYRSYVHPLDIREVDIAIAPVEGARHARLLGEFTKTYKRLPYSKTIPIPEERFSTWASYPISLLPPSEQEWLSRVIRDDPNNLQEFRKADLDKVLLRFSTPNWLFLSTKNSSSNQQIF